MSRTAIITPPLSSNASSNSSGSEVADEERRRELSPSPDVELFPDFDNMDDDIPMPSTPIGSFTGRFPPISPSIARQQRSTSPPLEKDEKEFTQTAEGLQKRKLSGDMLSAEPVLQEMELEFSGRDDLFGGETKTLTVPLPPLGLMASPAIRPTFTLSLKKDGEPDNWAKLNGMLEWDRSPENIELEELEGLMDDY